MGYQWDGHPVPLPPNRSSFLLSCVTLFAPRCRLLQKQSAGIAPTQGKVNQESQGQEVIRSIQTHLPQWLLDPKHVSILFHPGSYHASIQSATADHCSLGNLRVDMPRPGISSGGCISVCNPSTCSVLGPGPILGQRRGDEKWNRADQKKISLKLCVHKA